MTKFLRALGAFCVHHRYSVIIFWVVAAAALGITASRVGGAYSTNLSLPGTDSQAASDLLNQEFPAQANGTSPIVLQAPTGTLTDSNYQAAINETVSNLKQTENVSLVVSPLSQAGAQQLSADKTIGYISVGLGVPTAEVTTEIAQNVFDAGKPAEQAGLTVAAGGTVGDTLSYDTSDNTEVVGVVVALVVLFVAFGAALAAATPVVTAIFGVVSGLSLITLLSHAATIPNVASTLAVMLGLGVGIDYALFLLSDHIGRLRRGRPLVESISQAAGSAGGAIVFAASTVIIALVSLSLARLSLVTELGLTAAMAVLVVMLAALTLVPAVLAVLGKRVLPKRERAQAKPRKQQDTAWLRWARAITHQPRLAAAAALVLLSLLAIPVFSLQLGIQDDGALPEDTTARQAYDLITTGFGVGTNGPILVVTQTNNNSQLSTATVLGLRTNLATTSNVQAVSAPSFSTDGTAALLAVIPATAPSSDSTQDLVNTIRGNVIPNSLNGTASNAYVGGLTATYIDLAEVISSKLPQIIVTVVVLSFVMLLLAFRSLVIPLIAAVMTLFSVGAAYGVLVAVFQWGWLVNIVGLDTAIPIVSYVPLMMFAIIFGLSMDYQFFLLTHIKAAYDEPPKGAWRDAVVKGAAKSGKVIASAALVMVSVFSGFILSSNPIIKEFGLGLSTGVALYAAVVINVLMPTLLIASGKRVWWLPKWLNRILPRITIEG